MPRIVHHADGERFTVFEYHCTLGPGDEAQKEFYGEHTVAVVQRGSFTYRTNDREYLIEAGSVLLGEPGMEFEIAHEYGCGDLCLVFGFRPELLDELGRSEGFGRPVLPASARIASACLGPVGSGALDIGWDEAAYFAANSVLAAVERPARQGATLGRRVDRDRVHDAAAILIEHSAEGVDLEQAAHVAGLSPFHFLRVFQRELGLTPHQFLVQARLRRALELLRDSSLPVTEVAYEVGFGDLSHFQNTFRRHVGVTPGNFRRGFLPVAE
jgi:AraC family transcriptional regulator